MLAIPENIAADAPVRTRGGIDCGHGAPRRGKTREGAVFIAA